MRARGSTLRLRTAGIPAGTLAVGAGLIVLGIASYAFLGIGARALSSPGFAELSVVWTVLFTLGPGLFLPLEQETAKRLAVMGAGPGAALLMRRAIRIAAVMVAGLTVLSVGLMSISHGRLLTGAPVWIGMMAANSALAVVHCSRGWLAGTGRFGRYGTQLGLDGCLRVLGAVTLVLAGVHSVAAFAWVLCAAQLIAVALTVLPGLRHATTHQSQPAGAESNRAPGGTPLATVPSVAVLGRSISLMMAATLASQLLISAGPLAVKLLAAPTDIAAGRFLTTLVVARVPLFLFSALQASLLPGLAKMAGEGDRHGLVAAVRRLSALLVLLGGVMVVVLAIAGPAITSIIFGPEYRAARLPLAVLALGCTMYMVASVIAQAVLALHASGIVAIGWWIGVAVFAASLVNRVDLPLRVSVALLVGSAAAGLWFAGALRQLIRTLRTPAMSVSSAAIDG